MLLELFPDQPEKEGAVSRTKQRTVAAKMVLADGGELLLASLPNGASNCHMKCRKA